MKSTPRETAAVHALADALMELIVAIEEGRASRQPPTPPSLAARPIPKEPAAAPEPLLLTGLEAAAMLGVSHGTLLNYRVPRGPIPFVKIGASVRYRPDDIKAAISLMRVTHKEDTDDH